MRNPFDLRFLKTQALMKSGQMTGVNRPVGRVTWAKGTLLSATSAKTGVGDVRFLDKSVPEYEILTVQTIDINRSIGQDAATCTIKVLNARGSSNVPEGIDTSGNVGYLTPGRGGVPTPHTLNNVQRVTLTGEPTGGYFLLQWNVAHGDHIAIDASALDVLDAIVQNPQIGGDGNVTVSGADGGPWDIEFIGDLGQHAQPEFWGNPDFLTGGDNPGVTVETIVVGGSIIPVTSVYSQLADPVFGATEIIYPVDWDYQANPYRDVFIPNTILRTYQGYGSANFDQMGNPFNNSDEEYVAPQDDSQLWMTGVWLIDKVTISTDGTMSLECRDVAKLLIEQYIYPPMIPIERFPLIYCPAHEATGQMESIGANVARFDSSSVDQFYGYNASVLGHQGTDAFDANPGSFWLSGPNNSAGDIEWLQAATSGPINEVVLQTYGGNYIVYVCVHENGAWQGTNVVSGTTENNENLSYSAGSGSGGGIYVIVPGDTLWDIAGRYYGNNFLWPVIAQANANIIKDPHWIYPGQQILIPYVDGTLLPPPPELIITGTAGTTVAIPWVAQTTVGDDGLATISLDRTYNADYVRIVLANLHPLVDPSTYRAGIAELNCRNHIPNTYIPSTLGVSGYIQDWTEPVKEMCAWAGLTWVNPPPPNVADPLLGTTGVADVAFYDKITALTNSFPSGSAGVLTPPDGFVPSPFTNGLSVPLRVWGDFEFLGAGPVVCTPGDYFLSKSFMDGIRLIVNFIGGIFYVDETGGAQFRLPNVWGGGNFINDTTAASSLGARISEIPIEFHEDANLTEYSVVISDEALRSEILVVGGYDPNLGPQAASAPIAGGYVLGYDSATQTTSAIDFSNVLAGQYRLMVAPGDSTNLFYTEAECQRMAELTALFILFTYRQGQVKAPCHPGLQIDDQVRIFERISNEYNIHYVSGITTHQDLQSGEYSMTANTHWLGSDPDKDWFVDKQNLTPAVLQLPAVLARAGMQAGGDNFEQPPYGVTS